jgi:hypothetical protein
MRLLISVFTGTGKKEILLLFVSIVACALLRLWQFNEEKFNIMMIHAALDFILGLLVAVLAYYIYMKGPGAMASMLATGYYLAFIQYIKIQIDDDAVAPKIAAKIYKGDRVRVICYYPSKFDQRHIDTWANLFDPAALSNKGWTKDSLAAPNNHRGDISIYCESNGADLIIHDAMTTYMTVFYYCRDALNFNHHFLAEMSERVSKKFIGMVHKELNSQKLGKVAFPIEFKAV